ncbi:MAG: multidrug efflux SMR transporter [Bacteriovoracaceae bacterium]
MSSAWLMLLLAGLLEISWAGGLKYTDGFTRLGPSVFTILTLMGSMYFLAKATQVIPLGTAYAIWVGIGTIGAVALGVLLFKESMNFSRMFFLSLLLVSIIGLKATAR